jgi:phosphate starvation-inducible membrane PsiE
MKKSLRLSETWFNRGLWLVALVFAGFLIGLGGQLVQDLPGVDRQLSLNDYIDSARAEPLRQQIEQAGKAAQEARLEQQQARLLRDAAQSDSRTAAESFQNWIATRQATQQAEQNAELLKRTQQLDVLKARELQAIRALETQDRALLNAEQAMAKAQSGLSVLEQAAQKRYDAEARNLELRVFLIRLAITLPLLVLAVWLFKRQRKSPYWPFVWGFIFFAGFAFFVELVPYLPSYGGYVRYLVGIALTALIGRQAIVSLSRYLEKQRAAELLSSSERQQELGYDAALNLLGKGVCPGCERGVDLKNTGIDFCPHCGMGLFCQCANCQTRKSTFTRFCHGCGQAGNAR